MKEFTSQAQKWGERYDLAASHQEPLFKKFAAWYDIANAVYPSDRKVAPWRSKVLFPTLGNKAWQLAAKFVGLKPGWAVRAKLPVLEDADEQLWQATINHLREQEDKAQHKLDYDYDCPEMEEPMREKLLAVMMDAIVTGTGLGKAPWTVKKKEHYEHLMDNQGNLDPTQEKVTTKTVGYNDFIPVNIFNVFIAPSAHNLYGSNWVIIKEYKTLAELRAVNGANGDKFYTNLDKLKDAKADADRFASYKASRNRIVANDDPVALDETISQLPIFECYDLNANTIEWYVDAGAKNTKGDPEPWILIRRQKNIYWHGKFPLVPFYIKKKSHDFWGMGIFQTNERVDAAKNDTFNHYMDNWNLSVDGGIIAEEDSVVNDYLVEPGFELTYKGQKPEQFKFPEPNPSQLTEVSQMLDRAIEDGTLSPYSAGTPNAATDTTAGTKGGILAIQQQADDILSFGRANFRTSITQLGKFFLSNNQQFMDEAMAIPKDGSTDQALVVSPADLQGELDLEVTEDSMQPLSKDQMRQSFEEFTAQLLQMQAASLQQAASGAGKPLVVNFGSLAEEMAEQFGQKSFERFIYTDEEVQQMMAEAAQAAQQQQQQQMQQQAQMQQEQQAQQETGKADQAVQGMVADLAAQGHVDPSILNQPEGTPIGQGIA